VQFDIDFVMKCWLIKYLSIYSTQIGTIPNTWNGTMFGDHD